MAHEIEPAAQTRKSLSPLALLGILVSSIFIFSRSRQKSGKSPQRNQQRYFVRPQNSSNDLRANTFPESFVITVDPMASESNEDSSRKKKNKWKQGRKIFFKYILSLGTLAAAIATSVQAYYSKKSIEQNSKLFGISENSNIVVGRKDGILAEFVEVNNPDNWPTINLYLQNAGRLPAMTVCVSTDISGWPADSGHHQSGNILLRQRGKDGQGEWKIQESSCPSIGGDSTYRYVITKFFQQKTLNKLKTDPTSQINLSAVIQQCDSFGHYSCKIANIQFLPDTLTAYGTGESDCTENYGQIPNMVFKGPDGKDIASTSFGANNPLPPCTGDNAKTQEQQLSFLKGWIGYIKSRQTKNQ